MVVYSKQAGLYAPEFFGHYSASKFAVVSIMDSLRREISKALEIRCVTICPGFVQTPLLDIFEKTEFDDTKGVQSEHVDRTMQIAQKALSGASQFKPQFQTVESVAFQIVDHAILRNNPVPVIIIDKPILKLIWSFVSLFPSRLADSLKLI